MDSRSSRIDLRTGLDLPQGFTCSTTDRAPNQDHHPITTGLPLLRLVTSDWTTVDHSLPRFCPAADGRPFPGASLLYHLLPKSFKMPARHPDEYEYAREARGVRRERDGRDVREREVVREAPRARREMDAEPQRPSPRMMDPDMMGREPAARVANAGVPRQDPRAMRTMPAPRDPRDRDDEMMYDNRPSQYPPIREQPGARRFPHEGEFDDIPQSVRPIIDPGRSRDEPRPSYNEYFLPGEGIDREVIQSEICRYLGQDATCKPGAHTDVWTTAITPRPQLLTIP